MSGFLSKEKIATRIQVERCTSCLQLPHSRWAFLHQNFYCLGIAKRTTCCERILSMEFG